MNMRLAYVQLKAIVAHRKMPNEAKNLILHRKRGRDARIYVSMPDMTETPMSAKAPLTRSSLFPGVVTKAWARWTT